MPLPLHACLLPQRVDGRTYPLDCSYVGMQGNANPIGRMAQCPLFRSVQNSSTVLLHRSSVMDPVSRLGLRSMQWPVACM